MNILAYIVAFLAYAHLVLIGALVVGASVHFTFQNKSLTSLSRPGKVSE